ncbi:SDR family oxidoreductase [Candidatus Woesebacteria bacterium]|nr:SDR family oxidoreductase [Candidatus Woesebacteria bacterium]
MIERLIGTLGGHGLVGERTIKLLQEDGIGVLSPSSSEVDVTNKNSVEKFVSNFDGDVILLLAAWTDVEGAEKNPEKARRVNVDGTRNVAEASKNHNKLLVFISTDFVFEGTKESPGPYNENAQIASIDSKNIGEYARSKVMAEKILNEVGGKFAIVRISYPFGNPDSPKDFVNRTISYIEKGYKLFDDQLFTPTYIPDLVKAIEVISKNKLTGVFHVASHSVTNPYEFGVYVAQKTGKDPDLIGKGSLREFLKDSSRTKKPVWGGLDPFNSERILGLKFKSWKEAVDQQLEKREPALS